VYKFNSKRITVLREHVKPLQICLVFDSLISHLILPTLCPHFYYFLFMSKKKAAAFQQEQASRARSFKWCANSLGKVNRGNSEWYEGLLLFSWLLIKLTMLLPSVSLT